MRSPTSPSPPPPATTDCWNPRPHDHQNVVAGTWHGSPKRAPQPHLHDHGQTDVGACRNRSEKTSPLVIMGMWRSEQPHSHDHGRGDGGGRERSRHDHGSLAAGAWRDKSEMPPSAPSAMIPGRSQSPRLGDPRDHGGGAAGTATSP